MSLAHIVLVGIPFAFIAAKTLRPGRMAAITVSVASSPIFLRKASGPLCSRRAT